MTTSTIFKGSLFDVIDTLDNTARIPALRGIVHSTMAKCIGAIRQDIRERTRNTRNQDNPQNDIDQRNEFDENDRSKEQIAKAMGFQPQDPPLKQASVLHATYDWALDELNTIITSQWDAALTLEQMLEFMTKKTRTLDKTLVNALATAAGTDPTSIERMHELQEQREREQLLEATPEIILTFNGFGSNGYEDSIDNLPAVVQHQLGVKVVESLSKAKDSTLLRVLRTKRISDLGSIPLIDEGIKKVSQWVTEFEQIHRAEIHEAMEAGRFIRTLEDVIPA